MKIKTDKKWRNFITGQELPAKVKKQFGYIKNKEDFDNAYFVKYENKYYLANDFLRLTPNGNLGKLGWTGLDDYNQLLIKIDDISEKYIIGSYTE